MLGKIFCWTWAHNWRFMFANDRGYGVVHCKRCGATRVVT